MLAGALRALTGASVACRQTAAAAATLLAAGGNGFALVTSVSGAESPAALPGLQQAWHVWRCSSSLAAQSAAADSERLLLRDADDEAMSPHPPTTGAGPLTVRYPFPVTYYKDVDTIVHSLDEQPMGLVRLPGAAFNVPVRIDILHRVARYWRAKWQQGTHKTKTRAEVSGGGRKPWRQKKTGRARQGSIRSPLWKGGGTTFGPRPRSHAHALSRSTRLLGMRCALSAKVNEGRFFVVDDFLTLRAPEGAADPATSTPATSGATPFGSGSGSAKPHSIRDYRELKDRIERLTEGSYGSTWLLVDSGEMGRDGGLRLRKMLKPSVRMKVMSPEELTVYHVLQFHRLVVTRAAAESLSESLTRPHRVAKPVKHAWWMARKAMLDTAVQELNEAAEAQAGRA